MKPLIPILQDHKIKEWNATVLLIATKGKSCLKIHDNSSVN